MAALPYIAFALALSAVWLGFKIVKTLRQGTDGLRALLNEEKDDGRM